MSLPCLLCGCVSTPKYDDPLAGLALAESDLAQGDVAAAVALFKALDKDMFTGEDLERYLVKKATALAENGDLWDAYKEIRDFGEDHAFSPYITDAENLEFRIGRDLIEQGGGFLFFTSNADDGRTVLEHFTLRYPKNIDAPNALRLLGELAFEDGDYTLAGERFRDLLLNHENSEWVPLARFRIAMASYHVLVGPAYDLLAMERARNELTDFLASPVENPAFEKEAREALTTVRDWLGTKHLEIADFYRTIGNSQGERVQLQIAAEQYPDTPAGKAAATRQRLATEEAAEVGPSSGGGRP